MYGINRKLKKYLIYCQRNKFNSHLKQPVKTESVYVVLATPFYLYRSRCISDYYDARHSIVFHLELVNRFKMRFLLYNFFISCVSHQVLSYNIFLKLTEILKNMCLKYLFQHIFSVISAGFYYIKIFVYINKKSLLEEIL